MHRMSARRPLTPSSMSVVARALRVRPHRAADRRTPGRLQAGRRAEASAATSRLPARRSGRAGPVAGDEEALCRYTAKRQQTIGDSTGHECAETLVGLTDATSAETAGRQLRHPRANLTRPHRCNKTPPNLGRIVARSSDSYDALVFDLDGRSHHLAVGPLGHSRATQPRVDPLTALKVSLEPRQIYACGRLRHEGVRRRGPTTIRRVVTNPPATAHRALTCSASTRPVSTKRSSSAAEIRTYLPTLT